MDLSFSLSRSRQAKRRKPMRLDYPRLVARTAAAQAGTRTAAVEASLAAAAPEAESATDALVTLFECRRGWVSAVDELGGSFHPGLARQNEGAPS